MTENDPCPLCGKNRKMVGYSHRCVPSLGFIPVHPEARREEASPETADIATKEPAKAPKVSLTRPPKKRAPSPEVSAVVAQIEDKKSAKASRKEKRSFTVWLGEGQIYQLKIAAAKHKTTQEAIVAEGVGIMLSGKYR